jgi:hypothetical protein
MKWLFSICLIFSFSHLKAEVGPGHIDHMLDQMVRDNVISATEAEKAKVRMKITSPEQWKAINHQATAIASRSPASFSPSHNKIQEVHGIDLDGAQFKTIQNELKRIAPHYRD